MTYQRTTYQLTDGNCVIKDGLIHIGTSDTPELPNTTVDYLAYQAWLAAGNTPAPVDPPTPAQIQTCIVNAVQSRLDAFAATRNYDSILSACTYATSTIARFASDGKYCVDQRDATWAALYAFMERVLAGAVSMPTGFADVEPLLPRLEWPL